ncbi:MAG TPA: squalene synthase HpnC [Pirellulales bacterium]|nr:squalene synthase HpnC [Pirellulales bacterium]
MTTELARYGPRAGRAQPIGRDEALAYCRNLALRHYENFTVASWLLPRHLLPHFYAIYAYCRWADDLADELGEPAESLRLLDWWESQLERCYAGEAEHPVFIALLPTIEEFSIPKEPFARLLIAFRQDQHVKRYATAEDLLTYCQNSANPVGRLVLYVGRCHDEERGKLSDSISSGLQLTNFCQDVARDWAKDRIYLPRTTLDQAGYTDAMFARRQYNEAFRRAMREEVDRAEHFLRSGEPLVDRMPADLRIDVALFVAGGLSVLSAIRNLDFNVWRKRPRLSRVRQLGLLTRCWWHATRRNTERPAA